MRTKQLFTPASLVLLLIAAATGCTDDHSDANEPIHTGLPVDFASIRIAASANGGSGAGSMPTTDAGGFYPGDVIRARLLHNGTTQDARLTNIGTAGTPNWKADTPVYWQSTTTVHTLTLSRGAEEDFTLPDDMNATTSVKAPDGSGNNNIPNYTLHDRLFYTSTDRLPGAPIDYTLEHRMAQIVVTLTRAEGSKLPTDDDLRAARVSMELPAEGHFDGTTGKVTNRNTRAKKPVKFLKGGEQVGVHSHFAVALPGSTDTEVITITIPVGSSSTGNEQKYQYTATGPITLEAGSSRVFHLSLGARVSAISIKATAWQPVEQRLGVSEGYGIEGVTAGKLKDLLPPTTNDYKHISVSGVLNDDDYSALKAFLNKLPSPVSLEIEITGGSRSIPEIAFHDCRNLGAVALKGITEIGKEAFRSSSLTSITLPEELRSIGQHAFVSCQGLKSITLPSLVTKLNYQTFNNCANLASVSLPKGLKEIGEAVFQFCTSLKSIDLPPSVTTWGSSIFLYSGLTSIALPEGMTEIPSNTFQDCYSLQTITLHSKITAMGNYAFQRSGLTSIILPEGLKEIGINAFEDCKLLKVAAYISPNIKVGTDAFKGTPDTKQLFDYGISSENSISGSILNTDWQTIHYKYKGSGDKLAPNSYNANKQLSTP